MTNLLYFTTVRRDDESVSSSSLSDISEPAQTVAQAPVSAYSIIGKAWLPCAGQQLVADDDEEEDIPNSTTTDDAAADGNTNQIESITEISKLMSISYSELRTATRSFHNSNRLGSGDFGSVFKGWIDENTLTATEAGLGIPVAVKRFDEKDIERLEDINYMGRFRHPNLVRTVASCTENWRTIVVYEFMPQGSLDDLLERPSFSNRFSWSLRMKVALGAAKGLNFLHRNGIVHKNIKPSNILLDSDYNSKLSFGPAKKPSLGDFSYYEPHPNIIHLLIKSKLRYTAPECIVADIFFGSESIASIPTISGDVYGFGVVLLEILVGRMVLERELHHVRARGHEAVISRLDRDMLDYRDAIRVAKKAAGLVIACLAEEKNRVSMDYVVTYLTEELGSRRLPKVK